MHEHAGIRYFLMKVRMQNPCRRIDPVVDAIIVDFFGINQNQFACAHSREVSTAWIDQELLTVVAHSGAEVIGNGLVVIEPCRPTKCGRQFSTSLFHLTHDPPDHCNA
jgi:hypothetical protein